MKLSVRAFAPNRKKNPTEEAKRFNPSAPQLKVDLEAQTVDVSLLASQQPQMHEPFPD